jgi:hypothetical protein
LPRFGSGAVGNSTGEAAFRHTGVRPESRLTPIIEGEITMAKAELTQSRMERALMLARQGAAASEARRKPALLNRAELASDPKLRDNRRVLETLLASYAAKSGLDLDRFAQLSAKNQDDLRRVAVPGKPAPFSSRRPPCRSFVNRWPAGGKRWSCSQASPLRLRPQRTSCWNRRS